MVSTNRNHVLYAIAAVIALVGALALGVPLGSLAWLALVAACPLTMFFTMRGTHESRGRGGHDPTGVHDLPVGGRARRMEPARCTVTRDAFTPVRRRDVGGPPVTQDAPGLRRRSS
ncbi:hypothetical protein ACFCZ1_29180 [Streptomyces sp. NPDC056224]|uniref:hypothetical protein n=1 Tax=Streptomyces sp. NPDC056224 TaxID=3345750 RepID=UPI0035DC5786